MHCPWCLPRVKREQARVRKVRHRSRLRAGKTIRGIVTFEAANCITLEQFTAKLHEVADAFRTGKGKAVTMRPTGVFIGNNFSVVRDDSEALP